VHYKPTANNRFIDDIESTYQKILGLRFGSRSKDGLIEKCLSCLLEFEIKGWLKILMLIFKFIPKLATS
jgi:hypothetical protein